MNGLRISNLPVVSLDLETGGLIPGKHTPLSIGAVWMNCSHDAVTDKNSFYIQLEWDTVVVTPQALRINKLDIANPPGPQGVMTNRSCPAMEGIQQFQDWLIKHSTNKIYALGINVGAFDLAMLSSVWRGNWPFHYRSIDLNSLFFALSQVQNKPFNVIKKEITEIAWKRSDFPGMKHNALADAWSNVYVWEECLRRFCGDCEVLC